MTNERHALPKVDGRTLIARRYRDILSQLAEDQGGADRLSEARLQLCRRFAASACLAEALEARLVNGEDINLADHALLSSTLVRIASRIGIERRMRSVVPILSDYLEAATQQPFPDDDDENEGFDRRSGLELNP
ncbi:MAG: hypothetical protein Q8M31_21265 [Beijerinckiaceae bacterium]|nr:hypothetical protein [Beijerinckiaceae bacterium]